MKVIVLLCLACLLGACGSSPQRVSEQGDPGLANSLTSLGPIDDSSLIELCQPRIIHQRAVLNQDCLNIIQGAATYGRKIKIQGRENKELKSLCETMWLPRCRHKY